MSKQVLRSAATKSVDQELAEHLREAEDHLIEALKLFSKTKYPVRHPDYVKRLERAQEAITALFREELVRIRGPVRVSIKEAVKRR